MAEAHGKLTNTPGRAVRHPRAGGRPMPRPASTWRCTIRRRWWSSSARSRAATATARPSRRWITAPFFGALAKWVAEVDDTARLPEYISPRLPRWRCRAGPGRWCWRCPKTCCRPRRMCPTCPPSRRRPPPWPRRRGRGGDGPARPRPRRPLVVAGGPLWTAAGQRRSHPLRRGAGPAGGGGVPAAGLHRQPPPELRRRSQRRHAARPEGRARRGRHAADPRQPVRRRRLRRLRGRSRRTRARRSSMSTPTPTSSAGSSGPISAIAAPAPAMLAALAAQNGPGRPEWAAWRARLRAGYEAWLEPVETPGAVKLENVVAELGRLLPEGSGDRQWRGQLQHVAAPLPPVHPAEDPTSAPPPAAWATASPPPSPRRWKPAGPRWPGTGDGCFQMTLNEMSTAVQHGAQVVVIVANNGRYGTIRMHQERSYPGRVSGTDLANPDFAALARAYGGARRRRSRRDADFGPAFERALASGRRRRDRAQARPRGADDDADLERSARAPSRDRRPKSRGRPTARRRTGRSEDHMVHRFAWPLRRARGNDGIVSISSLIVGVAAAASDKADVLARRGGGAGRRGDLDGGRGESSRCRRRPMPSAPIARERKATARPTRGTRAGELVTAIYERPGSSRGCAHADEAGPGGKGRPWSPLGDDMHCRMEGRAYRRGWRRAPVQASAASTAISWSARAYACGDGAHAAGICNPGGGRRHRSSLAALARHGGDARRGVAFGRLWRGPRSGRFRMAANAFRGGRFETPVGLAGAPWELRTPPRPAPSRPTRNGCLISSISVTRSAISINSSLALRPGEDHMGHLRFLGLQEVHHLGDIEIVVAQRDVDLVEQHHPDRRDRGSALSTSPRRPAPSRCRGSCPGSPR